MKILLMLPLSLVGLALVLTGCATPRETGAPPPASQADVIYLREEIRRLTARLEASDAELGRLQSEALAAQSSRPGFATAAQVQSLQTQLEDLQRQIRVLDAARAQDKKEIYDDISRKVATLIKAPPPPARRSGRPVSSTGYEHEVQSGESLSKIAAAYKVPLADILAANGLSDANNIRIGQKLFIPDPN